VAVREGDQPPLRHNGFRPEKICALSPVLSSSARKVWKTLDHLPNVLGFHEGSAA
jgi:hypothetical protein